jgi:hypothetical protein
VNFAVSSVKPSLDWDEEEHNDNTDDKVEVGKISTDDSTTILDDWQANA